MMPALVAGTGVGIVRDALSASRAKPESARRMMRVAGQHARICATIRAISSTAPAEASMFAGRSFVRDSCSTIIELYQELTPRLRWAPAKAAAITAPMCLEARRTGSLSRCAYRCVVLA